MPRSAWVLAGTFLVGEVAQLLARGLSRSDGVWVLLSMVLSALVVAWVSAGVLRARPGRVWFAAIVMVLVCMVALVALLADLDGARPADLVDLAFALAQLAALVAFVRTPYFREQRADPARPGPDISGLVLVALTVGMLGGLTAPADGDSSPTQLRVTL